MSNFDGYVFLDLETTGLDPKLCPILEVGILIVDKNFNTLATFSEVAYYGLMQENSGVDQFVIDMHTKNNLWAECAASRRSLKAIELAAVGFLEEGGWNKQRLTGSTINFDRSFLSEQMPKLHDAFHYRNYDVSTVKGLFEKYDWPTPSPSVDTGHRALPDCYYSMNCLRAYVERIDAAFNHRCRSTDEFDL